MSEFKGTSGNWFVARGSTLLHIHSKRDIAGIDGVCIIEDQFKREQTEANSLLISKAPEMLHALEYLINETNFQSHFPTTAVEIKELIKSATEI